MVEEFVGGDLRQSVAAVRFDWGPTGAEMLNDKDGCLVVVDVLSFTTAVTVAVGRGMAVLPYRLSDPGAEAFAAAHGAELAVRRRDTSQDRPWSLSPVALATAPFTPRLVLPSPNGAAIAAAANGVVVAACLRNAAAAAAWVLRSGYGTRKRPIAVIAAGERWPDGSLRPALEDGLGAGAVLHHLLLAGCELSAEAAAMATTYKASVDVGGAVRASASALELTATSFSSDVDLAIESDVDAHVPVLTAGAFTSG
ncbi:MAG TPA: 2-phosphosulfolactate phosphatase [Acidimicrobiales bacterium]|nr:2-phosphosulfolactate phosphatase [Acidimicrobiales bacterium]